MSVKHQRFFWSTTNINSAEKKCHFQMATPDVQNISLLIAFNLFYFDTIEKKKKFPLERML